MVMLSIEVQTFDGIKRQASEINELIIAGWAGRDQTAMEAHIQELEGLGIARPRQTPMFYRVSAARLSMMDSIDVMGEDSSGEAECVLLALNGRLLVGVGSDHTDRKLEAYGVTASKQICDKPISHRFWPYEEVAGHWDDLLLSSYASIDGEKVLYQEGAVAELLRPADLVRKYLGDRDLADGTAMFCGTMPAIGGVRPAAAFECKLIDPVLSRTITLRYEITTLAVAD